MLVGVTYIYNNNNNNNVNRNVIFPFKDIFSNGHICYLMRISKGGNWLSIFNINNIGISHACFHILIRSYMYINYRSTHAHTHIYVYSYLGIGRCNQLYGKITYIVYRVRVQYCSGSTRESGYPAYRYVIILIIMEIFEKVINPSLARTRECWCF